MSGPIEAYFVCGGKYHDMDYARLEVLKLLAEHEEIRTQVAGDYRDVDAIRRADFLITYTCDLDGVTEEQQDALAEFVASGKRWFALHGTNSILKFLEDGRVDTPRTHPVLMQTLGSQFIGHPPLQPFTVTNAAPDHPLVKGIEPFETDDELYLCEYHGEIEPLLETRFTGDATGFVENEWPDDEPRIVMYLHPQGEGEVLYFTLGHCRSKYDMRPQMDIYPVIERCAWQLPVFHELLRRGIRWSMHGLDAV